MTITEPNKLVAEVHDRMPVLLAEKDFESGLSGSASLELLKPADNDLLQRWPVSKRVNSSRAPGRRFDVDRSHFFVIDELSAGETPAASG